MLIYSQICGKLFFSGSLDIRGWVVCNSVRRVKSRRGEALFFFAGELSGDKAVRLFWSVNATRA